MQRLPDDAKFAARDPRRDARDAWIRALGHMARLKAQPHLTLPAVIESMAQRFGSSPALLDEHECLSYADLLARMNRYAAWALANGLKPGDAVCLLAPNSADYVAIWLGLLRAGCCTALVNTHLTGAVLAHALHVASPRAVIASARYAGALRDVDPALLDRIPCWSHGGTIGGFESLDDFFVSRSAAAAAMAGVPSAKPRDRALLLYTSGTTGLPKAANVSQARLMQWSLWFAGILDARASDRVYDCLPLYHSVGGIVAVGAMLASGGSVVIREKFSARRFWSDVCDTECTLFAYIGELCRFLVNGPPHLHEREHRLRLCFGNGLSIATWERFRQRFAIPRILEFYAATEGSFSLYNCESEPGAIGRIPPFLAHRVEVALIEVDPETGEPVRGPDGLCRRCDVEEVGEAISPLGEGDIGLGGAFEGYLDAQATARKILRNVFREGDAWYRSGDLMRQDARGFFYFADRIGDTFRWKGENVSTQEVEAVLASYPGVSHVAVYGVEVANAEGRAGMAAIVPAEHFDWGEFGRHVTATLPAYARPIFVRLSRAIDSTQTFKPMKRKLASEGFDCARVADPVFVYDPARAGYFEMAPASRKHFERVGIFV